MRWAAGAVAAGRSAVSACALLVLFAGGVRGQEERPLRPAHDLFDAGRSFVTATWDVVTFPRFMDRADAAAFAGVVAVGGLLYAYDGPIQDHLVEEEPSAARTALRDVGDFFEPLGLMGKTNSVWAAGAVVGWATKQEWLRRPSRDLLYSHFIAGLTRIPVRDVVGRMRPDNGEGPRTFRPGEGSSFPSGHASTVAQIAAVLAYHSDRTWVDVLLYGMAATVVFQRVDSEKHWASDAWIGAAWGWGVSQVVVRSGLPDDEGGDGEGPELTVVPGPGGPALALRIPLGRESPYRR